MAPTQAAGATPVRPGTPVVRSAGSGERSGSVPWLSPGDLLGKYRIVGRLGSGGMGAVYEAVHVDIGKSVALKTLNPSLAADERSRARFLREAAASSRLEHPAVVNVTDFGSEGEITFIVMELLRGEDLAAALARYPGGLEVELVADVMLAVCAGVEAAHGANIVHRDLKPQNIFLSHSSVGDLAPKVLDFGIAKIYGDGPVPTLTNSGAVLGTTHYLSPEQLAGRDVDARSDQFALGVILYEALTGRRPHEGETVYLVMRAIGDGRFHRPRDVRPDLPPGLEAVILRAMSHDPAARFESVHALGRALLPFASTKRRVLWSDYYLGPPARDEGAAAQAVVTRPSAAPGAPLPVTHTKGAPFEQGRPAVGPTPAPMPSWISSSPAISVPDTGHLQAMRPRRRGPAVLLGLLVFGLAGATVFLALNRSSGPPGPAARAANGETAAAARPAPAAVPATATAPAPPLAPRELHADAGVPAAAAGLTHPAAVAPAAPEPAAPSREPSTLRRVRGGHGRPHHEEPAPAAAPAVAPAGASRPRPIINLDPDPDPDPPPARRR
jgi:serine/threonine protein kinase